MTLQPGIYKGTTRAEYDAIDLPSNSSFIKHLLDSPAEARFRRACPSRRKTKEMEFGNALHTCVLEPVAWVRRYGTMPVIDQEKFGTPRHKAYRDEKARILAELEKNDTTVLDADEHALIEKMADAINARPEAKQLLVDGDAEVTVVGQVFGMPMKARLDLLAGLVLADLKTSKVVRARDFEREIARFKYHIQAAVYTEILASVGVDVRATKFIVVQKGGDWTGMMTEEAAAMRVAVHTLSEEALEDGCRDVQDALHLWGECVRTQYFPGVQSEVVGLPGWARRREEAPIVEEVDDGDDDLDVLDEVGGNDSDEW